MILPFSSKGCCKTHKSRSHPRRRSFVFVLGAFGAHHIFEVCNPSRARMRFLRMFVVNVLLALRFFTSGIDLQLVEYALAISNGKPRMILTVFTCTRFCNAMLLPPKRQQLVFQPRRFWQTKNALPALEVSRNSGFSFQPSVPCTFFCRRRPAWECYFCFFQHLCGGHARNITFLKQNPK